MKNYCVTILFDVA